MMEKQVTKTIAVDPRIFEELRKKGFHERRTMTSLANYAFVKAYDLPFKLDEKGNVAPKRKQG